MSPNELEELPNVLDCFFSTPEWQPHAEAHRRPKSFLNARGLSIVTNVCAFASTRRITNSSSARQEHLVTRPIGRVYTEGPKNQE